MKSERISTCVVYGIKDIRFPQPKPFTVDKLKKSIENKQYALVYDLHDDRPTIIEVKLKEKKKDAV